MITLMGKSVFRGIAIGPLALFHRNTISTAVHEIESAEDEVKRFQGARETAVEQLKLLYDKAVQKVGEEQAAVFEVHQMMLEDDDYIESIEGLIRNEHMNAEAAVEQTAQQFAEMFRSMEDAYMQGRAADVLDISRRVQMELCGGQGVDFSKYDDVIIAADDLVPSETLQLDTDKLIGFITSGGSTSSHTAILARTLGIASVVGTGTQLHQDVDGMLAIIDGTTGMVYIDPDDDTLAKMKAKKAEEDEWNAKLEQVRGLESVTLDGQKINVFANIGNTENLPQVLQMMRKASDCSAANSSISAARIIRRKKNNSKPTKRQPRPWRAKRLSSGRSILALIKRWIILTWLRKKTRPWACGPSASA